MKKKLSRADDEAKPQHQAEPYENKVEQEHDQTNHLIDPPLTGCDGNNNKEDDDEEQQNGTEQPVTADSDWSQTVNK